MRLSEAFDDFISAQASRKPAAATLTAWRQDFSVMVRREQWFELEVEELDKRLMIAAFGRFAETHKAASVLRMWSTWNSLFDWFVTDDIVDGNFMQAIKRPKLGSQPVKAMHDDDLENRLYDAAEHPNKRSRTTWPKRDVAIMATFMTTGCRLGELSKMCVMDIRGPVGERQLVIVGKGNKTRYLTVSPALQEMIDDWLEERKIRYPRTRYDLKTTPMWVHVNGQPMTSRQVQYLVECTYRTAGIVPPEGAIVHAMRHTYATTGVSSGAFNVVEMKEQLGHESIGTTQQYLEATGQQLRDATNAHPGSMALAKRRKDQRVV